MLARNEFLMLHSILTTKVKTDFLTQKEADYVWDLTHPYVCVIHEPTGRGYYLNRNYEFMVDVENCPVPGDELLPDLLRRCVTHETELQHQAASFTTPDWANELPGKEFTTYWLY